MFNLPSRLHVEEGNFSHFLQPKTASLNLRFKVLVFGLILSLVFGQERIFVSVFVEGGVDFNRMTRVTRNSELFVKGI